MEAGGGGRRGPVVGQTADHLLCPARRLRPEGGVLQLSLQDVFGFPLFVEGLDGLPGLVLQPRLLLQDALVVVAQDPHLFQGRRSRGAFATPNIEVGAQPPLRYHQVMNNLLRARVLRDCCTASDCEFK